MKLPAIQFYPGDWLRDNVAGCSLAAQGLWLRMMLVAHDSDSYGKLSVSGRALLPAEIARRCGCSVDEFGLLFKELESAGVPSRDANGVIFSRRMIRDAEIRAARVMAGSKGGSKTQANIKQNTEGEAEDENEVPKGLRTPAFIAAWSDWERQMSALGVTMTPDTKMAQLVMLASWGPDAAVASIRESIRSSWKKLVPPKVAPVAAKRPELPTVAQIEERDAKRAVELERVREESRRAYLEKTK